MAYYKYATHLTQVNSDVFDKEWGPGQTVPHSGVWRCKTCGNEVALNLGTPFPPETHHVHSPLAGPIRWMLLVWA